MSSLVTPVGRFDYVEPHNLNLDKTDTEIVNKPEDYCISVNLEVEIPSRFYNDNPTYINASSDNGSISFFGGVDTSNSNSLVKSGETGFLSTSWTDISVNTTDRGNRDCIGIESINISYSPTFFPVVAIKFVDVRGASLFMPQEKSYEEFIRNGDVGNKIFQSSSFFKSLFSMPSPIFKLTIKGFYGQSVTYKLMMSKSSFDFDAQNGNFIANVEFAGYMYGIYTELPMSYIALAPYIDDMAYWNEKKFTFKNGTKIPTIPIFVENVVRATEQAKQESSQSLTGKNLTKTKLILEILTSLKNNFPLKVGDDSYKPLGKINSEGKLEYYNFKTNVPEDSYKTTVTTINECKNAINELKEIDNNLGKRYEKEFEEFLNDCKCTPYNDKYILKTLFCRIKKENNSLIIDDLSKDEIFDGNGNLLFYNNKKESSENTPKIFIDNNEPKNLNEFEEINELYKSYTNGNEITNTTFNTNLCGFKFSTNILTNIEKDLKTYSDKNDTLIKEVNNVTSQLADELLGFSLSIENVYTIIFAHIDTFMNHYYNVLRESNDSERIKKISNYKQSVCDVPDKVISNGKVPPYPTFVKEENNKKIISWPYNILGEHIPETIFVEKIINAATQCANDFKMALETIGSGVTNNSGVNSIKNRIPTNAVDLIMGTENPYSSANNTFNQKGEGSTYVDEIKQTFVLRCYYFALMYRKYFTNDVYVNDAIKFFATCEATNIKKQFGEKLSADGLVKLNELKNIDNIIGKSDGVLGYKYIVYNNDYVVIPVYSFDNENIVNYKPESDIKDGKYENGNYIILKKDGTGNDILNTKAIGVERDGYFNDISTTIKADEDFVVANNGKIKDVFIDVFFNDYIGGYPIIQRNKMEPYTWNGDKIFKYGTKECAYYDVLGGEYEEVSLISNKKNFTSYVNNEACINTIALLCDKDTWFTDNKDKEFLEKCKFLNSGATDYEIAYYFLWSLPLNRTFCKESSKSIFKSVPKTVLLREGSQYYCKDKFDEFKKNIKEGFGNEFKKANGDCVPIVATRLGKSKVKRALYVTKENDEYERFNDWFDESAEKNKNRREFLKKYFTDWVDSVFSNVKQKFGNLVVTLENGLPEEYMKMIIDIYCGNEIFYDYSQIIKDGINGKDGNINDFIKKSYNIFYECLTKDIYTKPLVNTVVSVKDTATMVKSSEDIKLSVYLTLQNLYNKFIAGNEIDRWQLNKEKSDFKNFLYLDTYYNEIGQRLFLNGTNIMNTFKEITSDVTAINHDKDGSNRGSVYNFLSLICQRNGLNLMAMPINPYLFTTQESSEYDKPISWDLFDTIPYTRMKTRDSACFISLYTYKPSEHLDISDNNNIYVFENDGFDINKNGEKDLPVSLQCYSINNDTKAPRVPSFAVSYAKQNQSIFKNINISTSNYQTTDTAIAMTFNIASQSDNTPRQSMIYGQDIYSVYSNYAYMCEVEMMGCAPISPMMYFQLNNIPMFKGAYLIYSVEHNITAGNMVTKFKGNRVNKHAIPFAKADVIYLDENGGYMGNVGGSVSRVPLSEIEMAEEFRTNYTYNPTPEQITENKNRMQEAINVAFTCFGGPKESMCTRYVYSIAYTYKTGKPWCKPSGANNPTDKRYWENLKGIGYQYVLSKKFRNANELIKYMENDNVNIGDVYVYYNQHHYHTQIYNGGITGTKWTSSLRDNYGKEDNAKYQANNKGFVYGNSKTNGGTWVLKIFRANNSQ